VDLWKSRSRKPISVERQIATRFPQFPLASQPKTYLLNGRSLFRYHYRMPIEQDSRAWKEGYQAGATASQMSCPYPVDSLKAWSWHGGWIEGDARRRQALALE
jgi:ribosome modulation factor